MTVSVTRPDGGIDEYMRSGDAYVQHADGTLDVVRTGSKVPRSYASEEWTDVKGDQSKWKKRRFFGG
jgi:hypothetical protein